MADGASGGGGGSESGPAVTGCQCGGMGAARATEWRGGAGAGAANDWAIAPSFPPDIYEFDRDAGGAEEEGVEDRDETLDDLEAFANALA